MTRGSGQEEIVDSGTKTPTKRGGFPHPPKGWEPFANAPSAVRRRYAKQLRVIAEGRRPLLGIKLFCIECMGYSAAEARRCDSRCCPLYPFNRRIFKRPTSTPSRSGRAAGQRAGA